VAVAPGDFFLRSISAYANSDWVQPRLAREFDLVSAADGGLTFRRVAGDVFTLDVQRLTADPALRVRFTLRGEAY